MVAHFVDDALEDAGQFFIRQGTGVLRAGVRQHLFPAAGIVHFFFEDSFGGRHVLDYAGTTFSSPCSTLKSGNKITVTGTKQTDGSIKATAIVKN